MTATSRGHAIAATGGIALHALSGHILDHRLPAPSEILPPSVEQPRLVAKILHVHLAAWLATGVELGDQVVDREIEGTRQVTAPIQVPSGIGDVTVHLTWLEAVPSPVRLVRS